MQQFPSGFPGNLLENAMRKFLTLLLLGLVYGIKLAGAELALDIRLVKADLVTSEFIRNAVDGQQFTPAELEERLDQLVASRRVTELARFRQAEVVSGDLIEFVKNPAEIEVADGIKIPTGIKLQIEPTLGLGGLVDLRLGFSSEESVKKNKIEVTRSYSSQTLTTNVWELIAAWGDASESVLLMTCFSDDVVKEEHESDTETLRELFC